MVRIGITGKPRAGKTTLIKKISEYLKDRGVGFYGFYTEEIVENNRRVGFFAKTFNGKEGTVLAYEGFGRPRVGKYKVYLEEFNNFCRKIIKEISEKKYKIILIDEIGPMEMKSGSFVRLISILHKNRDINLISTIHRNLVDNFRKFYSKVYEISRENWKEVYLNIIKNLDCILL